MPPRLLALASAALLAATQSPSHAAPPIVIAVEDAAAPWSRADGTGFANDVVREAFAATGMPVRLSVVPYARCKRMVVAGEVAGCFSMSREPALDATVALSADPLFTLDVLLVSRGAPLPPHARVGIVLGYEYPDTVRALARHGDALEIVPSEEIGVRKVAEGRLDAAIVNANVIKPVAFVAARAGVPGRVQPLARLGGMPAFVGFSRAHPDGPRARAAFDDGMRRLRASGRLRALERAWLDRVTASAAR